MTIDEAIEILDNLLGKGPYFGPEKLVEAATLGKEALKVIRRERRTVSLVSDGLLPSEKLIDCTEENPCCDQRGEYNGFASGPLLFTCPKHCQCHD